MEFTRCLRCMKETASYPCPHCGYDPGTAPGQPHALRPGSILNGKYVVGVILGQGGFGITYIGWDLALESKVAIKEYFPSGQVVRSPENSLTLQWYTTPQAEAARNAGREMFLKEARKMSRVGNIPQVVRVRDLFQENDTAYIVMDFVEGETLMARLKKTGPLSWEQAQEIFLPAIRAMEQVHQEGLIHRDLSPDNLMLLPNGDVRILDLGAAKDLTINSGASSMQVAKGGFSPLEQYTQRGGSGPWSDVYAMAATMYYSLTGVLPPNAVDRLEDDQIRWDLPGLTALPQNVLTALKQAMAVSAKGRTQSMGEFLNVLEFQNAKKKQKKAKKKKKKGPVRIVIRVILLMTTAILFALLGFAVFVQTQGTMRLLTNGTPIGEAQKVRTYLHRYTMHSLTAQELDNGYVRFTLDITAPEGVMLKFYAAEASDSGNGIPVINVFCRLYTDGRQTVVWDVPRKDLAKADKAEIILYLVTDTGLQSRDSATIPIDYGAGNPPPTKDIIYKVGRWLAQEN